MRSYFLETGRIGFSKWTADDSALAHSLWGDEGVARFICGAGAFSIQEIEKRLALEIENNSRYSIQYWPIFSLTDGAFLGCCGLRPHDLDKGIYELGFHLTQDQWGKGYATEAAMAVIGYAFDVLKVNNLIAGHHPQNEGSKRVLLKLGFRRIEDAFYPPTGLYHAAYRYKTT